MIQIWIDLKIYIILYALYSMHIMLCIVLFAFYLMHFIWCIVFYAFYSMRCIPCILLHAICCMHCILCVEFRASYFMHCILCIVFFKIYSIHFKRMRYLYFPLFSTSYIGWDGISHQDKENYSHYLKDLSRGGLGEELLFGLD